MYKILRMSTQDCARTVGIVQAGRGLREICISGLYWGFLKLKSLHLQFQKLTKLI